MKTKRAFTLIELLVVIALIALLLSILLPGLKRAKDYARQTVCAAQLKQVGLGVKLYADAYDGYLPDDHDINGHRERHTYALYRNNTGYVYPDGRLKPLRLAYLYELDYIDVPEIFYCPANRLDPYRYASYTNPAPWGSLPQDFNTASGSNDWVRMGYTYYPVESRAKLDPASQAPEELALKQVRLNPNIPMVTDIIHNRPSISHQHNNLYKLNALYGDGHVSTCNDQSVFHDLVSPLGDDIWERLDSGALPSMSYYDTAIYTVFRAIGP
jgi:prepilin-type N-terminal cleavage/methylation domain-containing protein/prepilin-type processing-associated H-X9-DG protein